ncbi:MAG: DNA double-strand break repair nuclease NurA, partial [Candidatus Jordarchaeaceae archaeon]
MNVLKEFANHLAWKRSEEVPAIRRALEEACHWSEKVETLREKVKVSRTSWLTVVPDEPLNRSYDPPPDPNQYVVIATDGSQVLPDRTEAPPFYLINIGHAVLSYGTGDPPHLTSHPYLFVKDEDLSRVWSLTEVPLNWETVSLRRQLSEWTALKDLAEAVSRRPALALIDGSLILWNLEGKPPDVRNAHLSASLNLLDQLRQLGVPVAGFISSPASKDIINTLRVAICPYDRPDCDRCEWLLTRQVPPCAVIEGMDDAAYVHLWVARFRC